MRVLEIVKLDKKKAKVLVDNNESLVLYFGEIKKNGICPDEEIDDLLYDELYDIVRKRARERSLYLLQSRDYSESDMRRKLTMSYYPVRIVDETLEFLKKYSYIDDERYTKNIIENSSRYRSRKDIKMRLHRKGIAKDLISDLISDVNIDEVGIIRTKYIGKIEEFKNGDDKTRKKIYNMLLRKGFSYDDINTALNSELSTKYVTVQSQPRKLL